MGSVESIEELIEEFDHSDPASQGKIIKQMNIPISEFEAYASWNKEGYTRNCIHRTKEYEMILLCWDKGDETQIHGHGGQKCWVYQIEGQLTEIRYDKNESGDLIEIDQMELNPGKLTFMDNTMGYHKLNNDDKGRAMTLHVYVSPIITCEVFNDEEEAFEFKEMVYDTINGVALTEAE